MGSKRAVATFVLAVLALLAVPAPAPATQVDPASITDMPIRTDTPAQALGAQLEGNVVRGRWGAQDSATTTADGGGSWTVAPTHTLQQGSTTADDISFAEGTPTWRITWSGGTRDVATTKVLLSRDGTLLAVAASDHWSIQSADDATELYAAPLGAVAIDGRRVWSWEQTSSILTAIDLDHLGDAPRVVDSGLARPHCATTLAVWDRWALLRCESTTTLVDLDGTNPNWVVPSNRQAKHAPQLGNGFVVFAQTIGVGDPEYASLYVARADDHDLVELRDTVHPYPSPWADGSFGVDTASTHPAPFAEPLRARIAYASGGLVHVAEIDLTDPARDEFDQSPATISQVHVPAQTPNNADVTLGFTLADVGTGVGAPSGVYDATIVVRRHQPGSVSMKPYENLQPVDGTVQVTVPMNVAVGGQVCAAVRSRDRFGNRSEMSQDYCTTAVAPVGALTSTTMAVTSPQGNTVSLDATVTSDGATPTGRVDFYASTTVVASVPLIGGKASVSLSEVPQGEHGYTAQYEPSTTAFERSTSSYSTVLVAHTTTTSVALAGAMTYGGTRTATIKVTYASGAAVPLGSMEVTLDGKLVTVSGPSMTLILPKTQSVGTYTLKATYTGPSQFAPSTTTMTFTVTPAASTLTETFPSIVSRRKRATGAIQAYQSPLSTLRPTGTVVVKKGTAVIGRGTLRNGAASMTLAALRKGRHRLAISYSGSGQVKPATKYFFVTQR